jgi:hypothetical protein
MSIDISEITFAAVNDVSTSWDMLKGTPDSEKVVAETLFRKIIDLIFFEKKDSTAESNIPDKNNQNMMNPLFRIKSTMFVKMLDVVLQMLGPDLAPVADTLQELGAKHLDYGVSPGDYDIVGDALFFTLEKHLGDKWNTTMEKSWRSVYSFISKAMVAGTEKEAKLRAAGKSKRMSIPPRKSKLEMDQTIAKSMATNKAGLMGMMSESISVSERGL